MAPYRERAPLRGAAALTTLVPLAAVIVKALADGADASSAAAPKGSKTERARRMRTKAGRSALWAAVMKGAPGLRLRSVTCRGRGPVPRSPLRTCRIRRAVQRRTYPQGHTVVCPQCWALRSCHQRVMFDVPGAVAGFGEAPGAPPVGGGLRCMSVDPRGKFRTFSNCLHRTHTPHRQVPPRGLDADRFRRYVLHYEGPPAAARRGRRPGLCIGPAHDHRRGSPELAVPQGVHRLLARRPDRLD